MKTTAGHAGSSSTAALERVDQLQRAVDALSDDVATLKRLDGGAACAALSEALAAAQRHVVWFGASASALRSLGPALPGGCNVQGLGAQSPLAAKGGRKFCIVFFPNY